MPLISLDLGILHPLPSLMFKTFLLIFAVCKCHIWFTRHKGVKLIIIKSSWLGLWNTLHLYRWEDSPTPNECPVYDTKQSDGEALVMLELWVMQRTLS